ncbi:unnamed protein product, partial [Medioppia subpectinata]
MTYDLAGVWDQKTGHHSDFKRSTEWSKSYVDKGFPKEKVLVGVAFYGRGYTLKDAAQHATGAPIAGVGNTPAGADGTALYSEMCDLVKNKGWKKERANGKDPFAYNGKIWFGYDDPYQAYDKAAWVKANGYGGIIMWEVGQDDVKGTCCSVKFPMLRAINNGLFGTVQKTFIMKILLYATLVCAQLSVTICIPRVICYYPDYRLKTLAPIDFDPLLCTHIHFSFHKYDDAHNVIVDSTGSARPALYNRLKTLKKRNSKLKLMVAVAGYGMPDQPFSHMVNDPKLRAPFIKNTVAYLKKYGFDGLDLDWEYPVCWGGDCTKGPATDKPNFGKLLL